MVRSAQPDPIIVPDVTSLFGDDRTADLFPKSQKWGHGVFSYDGISAPYFTAQAPNEKALVVGCAGLNSHHPFLPEEVTRLNNEGISAIWIGIPPARHGDGFVQKFTNLFKEFLTNPKSPARVFFLNDVPRYVATHSTSGQIFLKLLHDERTREKLTHTFSGAAYIAPYFDTANASRDYTTFRRLFFESYASRRQDKKPHECLLSSAFLYSYARHEDFAFNGKDVSPTFGEILQVCNEGRRLLDAFNAEAARALPSLFILGNKDPFACGKTALKVAKNMSADIIVSKGGGHHPLQGHPEAMESLIAKINACVERHTHRRETTEYVVHGASQENPVYTNNIVRLRAA